MAKQKVQLSELSGKYPKPGPMGGRLIREVISFIRGASVQLPITSYIHIAVSGGVDSMALAHLLVHYGRRVVSAKKIRLVHINHGWRGRQSDADAEFVRKTARKWGVPIRIFKIKPPKPGSGQSWEEQARTARKQIFEKLAQGRACKSGKPSPQLIFTAHQADDFAETLLWRILTGTADTHGGGIAVRHGVELRPFLRIRKSVLQAYLEEEEQTWHEDSTNHEGRFLRSQMRQELMPILEKLFPRAIDNLIRAGLQAQRQAQCVKKKAAVTPDILIAAAGIRSRRPHFEALEALAVGKNRAGELHLPGGWRLIRERKRKQERWVLEKIVR